MCELAVGDPTRPVARPVLRLYPYSRAFIPTNVRDVCVGSRSMTLLVRVVFGAELLRNCKKR